MTGSPPLRAVLKLTYQCNSRCRFCRVEAFRDAVADVPRAEVGRKMAAARARGVGMILFSGGEPTLRNDLPLLARAATALGLRWGLITNGRRLAHPAYRQALLDLGLAYVHTSLHGATAARHDDLVQCASFDEVMTALGGLAGTGVELHVNTVVTRPNVAELDAIGDLLAPFAPLTHKLCLAEPRGLYDTYATQLMVPPQQAGRAASEAVARARARHGAAGLETVVEGFPLCQIPSALDAVANLRTHNIHYMSEGFEDDLFPTDHGDREYPAPCDDCAMRDACPGVYPGYVRRFGVIGLRAFRHPR